MHADALFGRVEGGSCSGASMTFTLSAKVESNFAGCMLQDAFLSFEADIE